MTAFNRIRFRAGGNSDVNSDKSIEQMRVSPLADRCILVKLRQASDFGKAQHQFCNL